MTFKFDGGVMEYQIPEKGQLSVYNMYSFGINITTRHGLAREMIELINFTKLVATKGLNKYIESVFYDSNSCCCTFTFLPLFDQYGAAADAIRDCALESISQFDWFNLIEHGKPNSIF